MNIFIPIKHISQRVPNKNFRIFNGEPLYKHTLLKFLDCNVFVDTDSEEIKNNINSDPRLKNVKVIERKYHLLGHETSVCLLIKDFIESFTASTHLPSMSDEGCRLYLFFTLNMRMLLKISLLSTW